MPTRSRSYRLGEAVVHLVTPLMFRLEVSGGEHLPHGQGCVIVANHTSHADPFAIAQFLTHVGLVPRFMTKDAVFRVPIVGRVLASAGQIPVARESTDAAAAFADAERDVLAGECVVIYPEGTLTRDPALWPMRGKSGAARLALATGCTVIPVAQWGSHELLPPYARWPRLGRRPHVLVQAGPSIDLDQFRPADGHPATARQLVTATGAIMAELTRMVAGLRGEQPPRASWDPRAHGQQATGRPDRSEG